MLITRASSLGALDRLSLEIEEIQNEEYILHVGGVIVTFLILQ